MTHDYGPQINYFNTAINVAHVVYAWLPPAFAESPLLGEEALDLLVLAEERAPLTIAGLHRAVASYTTGNPVTRERAEKAAAVIEMARELTLAAEDRCDPTLGHDYIDLLLTAATEAGISAAVLAAGLEFYDDDAAALALTTAVEQGADLWDALDQLCSTG